MATGKVISLPETAFAVASHAGGVRPGAALTSAHAVSVLAALAQPTRLSVFRLLLEHEPAGLTAGAVADAIGTPHNTISTHLAILVRAGLLRSARDGRTIVYRADLDGMRALVGFLVNDCCDGHPELCSLLDSANTCAPQKKNKSRKR